jgi:hypothetical protein
MWCVMHMGGEHTLPQSCDVPQLWIWGCDYSRLHGIVIVMGSIIIGLPQCAAVCRGCIMTTTSGNPSSALSLLFNAFRIDVWCHADGWRRWITRSW